MFLSIECFAVSKVTISVRSAVCRRWYRPTIVFLLVYCPVDITLYEVDPDRRCFSCVKSPFWNLVWKTRVTEDTRRWKPHNLTFISFDSISACDWRQDRHASLRYKGKGLDTCYSAILTWVILVTSSALQSRKWQLIDMSQRCRSALCGQPLLALIYNWPHGAAIADTPLPQSATLGLHPVAVATTHFASRWG